MDRFYVVSVGSSDTRLAAGVRLGASLHRTLDLSFPGVRVWPVSETKLPVLYRAVVGGTAPLAYDALLTLEQNVERLLAERVTADTAVGDSGPAMGGRWSPS